MDKKQLVDYLNNYFRILNNSFQSKKKIPFNEILGMCKDINSMINTLNRQDFKIASEFCTLKFIPLLELLLKIDNNNKNLIEYEPMLKNAYRISARTNLESYMIYREWELPSNEKFFIPRYEILSGYIHFLQEVATNPKFRLLIFNAPSGYGKTYPEKISEAWNFGKDPTGTVLALCSNDNVVKGGSRSVRDEMKSEWYGEVFPNMRWTPEDKNYFIKETDGEWKLRDCKLLASYYASTVNSNVVGSRASQRIHIDDLYADYLEAMNQELNEYFKNKYLTVWTKRFVQHLIPKVVVTGTLWANGDFIALLIEMIEKENNMQPHPKYKYCRVNKDETIVIIQVPALDENGESTCPDVKSTEEVMNDKNNMEEYLFETNFQQKPTDPEALTFSYYNLRTYDKIPQTDYIGTYSVIDATRKSGKDFFAMPIFTKVPNENMFDYYLKDTIFTRTATKDMYDEIVNKIIEHHIVFLVIESNVTSELKKALDERLAQKGVAYCEIVEKYNVENKQARITDQKGNIKRCLVFPKKGMYGINSDMGKAMNNLTLYNETGHNPNDDFPDACALMCSEIIDGGSKPQKPKAVARPF
jgi:hypothetical protein